MKEKENIDTLKVRDYIGVKEIDVKRVSADPSTMEQERCCGNCCWFYAEDTYGNGFCAEAKGESWGDIVRCDKKCKFSRGGCDNPCFVSKKLMRHYQAVLLQANRYRRDDNVPAIYKMPNPKELGKAIDFAVKYIKTFSNL